MLEDRNLGHREELRQILRGQGVTGLLDLICDRHSSIQTALLLLLSAKSTKGQNVFLFSPCS